MGPLRGIKVVEMAGQGPVPFATMILADLGAEITRIDKVAGVPTPAPESSCVELTSRGKRSVALDLKSPRGTELARQLIAGADVVLDPFRPGVMERLGLGPDELMGADPRLVYGRMTGWGQDGPDAQLAGHDINYISLSGALYEIGPQDEVPTPPINLLGDYGGGSMFLIVGVLSALLERGTSGRGQVVDAAMVDGSAVLMTAMWQLEAMGMWPQRRGAHFLAGAAPWYGTFETADAGFVSFGAIEPQFYAEWLQRLELDPDQWPQFEIDRWPAQQEEIAALIKSRTQAEWVDAFAGSDACFAPVLDRAAAAEHPHNRARKTFVEYDGVVQPAPAPRLSRTPGEISRRPCWPGEQTREILAELGLGDSDKDELLTAGVVAQLGEREADRAA